MATAAGAAASEQLDLFATAEHADRQRRAAEAPALFDIDGQLGYFARVHRAEQWRTEFGDLRSVREAHGWVPCISEIFSAHQPTRECRPTLLTADVRCDHNRGDCACVGDLYYRGACFGCDWEGPVQDRENPAVEDAHDHAWPGWRDLPIVPCRPDFTSRKTTQTAQASWAAQINDAYPDGWLESGGPIRTRRGRGGTRHVPARTGFGGYDLCGEIEHDPDREPVR